MTAVTRRHLHQPPWAHVRRHETARSQCRLHVEEVERKRRRAARSMLTRMRIHMTTRRTPPPRMQKVTLSQPGRLSGTLRARVPLRVSSAAGRYELLGPLGIVLSAIVAAACRPPFRAVLRVTSSSPCSSCWPSLPIYVCASEATPVAAALVLKGLSPGAALVFLLAGPATNIGSLVVLTKFLGARIMAIYLASIVVITLLAGFALNWVYRTWGLDPRATFGAATSFIPEPVKIGGALLLIILLVLSMRRTAVPGEWLWVRDRIAAFTGLRLTAPRLALAVAATLAVVYLGSGLFAVPPGEVGVTTRFDASSPPRFHPDCTTGCRGHSRPTGSFPPSGATH